MDLSHAQMRNALGVSATSLENWLRHSPRQRAGRGRGNDPFLYELPDVVTALRCNRKKGLSGSDLVALCDHLDDQPPDTPLGDPDSRADALLAVLSPEELQRVERAKRWAGAGAIYGLWSNIHTVDLPNALKLLALRPQVLRYILTNEKSNQFPTTRDAWSDFVILHLSATSNENTLASS